MRCSLWRPVPGCGGLWQAMAEICGQYMQHPQTLSPAGWLDGGMVVWVADGVSGWSWRVT
jgi:hypothetical protein